MVLRCKEHHREAYFSDLPGGAVFLSKEKMKEVKEVQEVQEMQEMQETQEMQEMQEMQLSTGQETHPSTPLSLQQ